MYTLKYPNIPSAFLPHITDILFSIFHLDNYFNISHLLSLESVFYRQNENDAFTNTGSLIYCHNVNLLVVLKVISYVK